MLVVVLRMLFQGTDQLNGEYRPISLLPAFRYIRHGFHVIVTHGPGDSQQASCTKIPGQSTRLSARRETGTKS